MPRTDLLQLDQSAGRVSGMLELVDADGSEGCHDSATGTFLRHLFGGTAECPSAPVEADDYGRDGTDRCTLQQALERLALQD